MASGNRILAQSALGLHGDEVEDAIEFECAEIGFGESH
jgi:hypothetical protein